MRIIRKLDQIKKYRRPVVALGIFDGVHLGHQRILKAAVRKARRIEGTSMVVTFHPHPQKEESIYSLEHRLRLLSQLDIDLCIVIKFTKKFSQIPAEGFIKDILVKKIGADYVYVGKNFRFGKNAQGDFKTLKALSYRYNFKAKSFAVVKINHQPVSSTFIRRLISQGELKPAARLLMRRVSILGTVIKGACLGNRLGFPTANIDPHHEVIPPSGVYGVKVIFNHQKLKNGICYIGTKPTFKAHSARRMMQDTQHIEVHIFDFKKNIYGRYLEIQFLKKIRKEKKFNSPQELVGQIQKDTLSTRKLFSLPKVLPQGLPYKPL